MLALDDNTPSWIKGRSFEEVVAKWAEARGYKYSRNVRVYGKSGSLHEIDLLLETGEGKVVVEVKNVAGKVDKDTVMKAAFIASDIGARGAIVVSSSGFTRSALRVAKALGVELLTLEEVINYIEVAGIPGDAIFLELAYDAEDALRVAGRHFAEKLAFIKREKPALAECSYHPFYYMKLRASIKDRRHARYKDVNIIASAVTGLPLSNKGRSLVHECSSIAHLPPDLLGEYKSLAGKIVEKREYTSSRGERRWRRLVGLLRELGLVEEVRSKPLTLKIVNVIPSIGSLEKAAELMLAPGRRVPSKNCKLEEPRVSPGSVSTFIESLLEASVVSFTPIYAPIYTVKLVKRDGTYRLVKMTGWLKKPMQVIDYH